MFICLITLLFAPILWQQATTPGNDVREVGSISLLDAKNPIVQQTFALAALDKPVVITRLSPSCHCASAVLLSGVGSASVIVYAKPASPPDAAEFVLARLTVP